MKKTDQSTCVDDGAKYLCELRDHQYFWERPSRETLEKSTDGKRVFHDHEALRVEINSCASDLKKAYTRLANLRRHFASGELDPFLSIGPAIGAATASAAKACAELGIAADRLSAEHPKKTRELTLQRSAVRLAYAYLHVSDPRGVRSAAKQMLLRAGIREPSERSLTAWIKDEVANGTTQ